MEEYAGSSGDGCPASTCSSWSDDCKQWRQCGSDRMVKRELDAARALAGLSQMAPVRDRDAREDERKGSGPSGSRRSEKRPATESIVAEEERKDATAVCVSLEIGKSKFTRTSGSIQNQPLEDYRWDREALQYMERAPLKDRPDSVLPKSSPNHPRMRMSFCKGKLRQNLSEAEKEEKRLRRILANRESARQTILRRQAFCEELTRKAADLAYDNSNLKKEKESIMKEYDLLKDQNKNLKNQASRMVEAEDEVTKSEVAIKTELEATPSENISANVERQSFMQQQQLPLPPYSRIPYTPFIWPPHYPFQMQNFPQNTNESKDSMASCLSHQWWIHGQETVGMTSLPFYMMPWPWFCPPLAPWHGLFSSDPHTSAEKVGSSADGRSNLGPTSESAGNVEKAYDLASGRLDASSSVETIPKIDVQRKEDGTRTLGPHSKGMVNAQNPMKTLGSTSTIKSENISQSDLDSKEVVSSVQLQKTDMSNPRKLVDASAAAEARKRRKELTKLKHRQPC